MLRFHKADVFLKKDKSLNHCIFCEKVEKCNDEPKESWYNGNEWRFDYMKKIIPILVTILLIIVVAIAGVITFMVQRNAPTKERMDSAAYYGFTDAAQTAIIVDGTISDTFGKKTESHYYIDYETVASLINKRFYWNEGSASVLYALPTEVREIVIEDGSGLCLLENGQLYLALEIVEQYTNITYETYTAPNRVVIRSGGETYPAVQVAKDTAVRYRGGIKSEVLTEAAAGTTLQILDDSFENWLQVVSSDGYVGYVDKASLGDSQEVTNPTTDVVHEYTSISRPYRINMVWHQTTSQAANDAVGPLLASVTGVNVIAPTWFIINDTSGSLMDISSASYVAMAHERGMEVWAVLNDFDGGISSYDETYLVLSNTEARGRMIDGMMASVLGCGIDGINVDIEKVSENCAPHYLQFLRELSVSCRKNGIVLSVDNYVPKNYSTYFDREEQGIIADYVVIMGYDEHFAGSETAGSVASLPFVEDGIVRTLEEVPAEKIINGIPFYTRIWNTDSTGRVTSEACSMQMADNFIASNGMTVTWSETAGQNYAELDSAVGLYQIWLEDEQSIAAKMNLIKTYNLAGVASWKLGLERSGVWSVIQEHLNY